MSVLAGSAVSGVRLLLKRTARTADIHRMELPPWWADSRLRLGLLLAGLAMAVLALLAAKTELFNRGSATAQTRGTVFAPGCPGQGAPEVESIPAQNLAALRDAVSRIMPPRVGRVYQAGTITTSNLWTDDSPQQLPSSSSQAGSMPAGYEVRWWALDRQGHEDDVVADVLEFGTERQAQNALLRAASPRCRSDGAAHAARFPSGAGNLYWVNPDSAQQWDVLFVRGRRLYRVDDVPPGYPPATGPAQRTLEQHRADSTVDVLACALPEAGCQTSAISASATNLATLTAGSSSDPGAPRPITRAQAGTYAHAVNLRGYDVPGMTQVAPEGPIEDGGDWETFARCTGEPRATHTVVTIHSPTFRYRGRLEDQSVYSTVAVLPSEGDADRFLAMVASARADTCIRRDYGRSLLGHAAKRNPLRLDGIVVTPQPTPAPSSYRGLGPYRATALRLTIQVTDITRRGRHVQLSVYTEGFAFTHGRAVIYLTTESFFRPFPQANEQYLMKMLVGRAEANEA